MQLVELIERAHAAGVTAMTFERGTASCWSSTTRRYYQKRGAGPVEALEAVLTAALAPPAPALLIDDEDDLLI